MLILVASTASYSDAWTPFTTLFERFWGDCPYRKVLFSDMPVVMPDKGGFSFTDIKQDRGWIQNLLDVLAFSDFPIVAVFQEDFFLTYPVDQPRIARILEWFEKSDYDCCRLNPTPGGEEPEIAPGIGNVSQQIVSCQVGMWKRERLMELCRRVLAAGGMTPAHFEIYGSQVAADFKVCGWIRQDGPWTWPIAYQCSAIANGKWMSGAVRFCIEQGIVLNPKRPILYADDADEAVTSGRYAEFIREMEAKQA